MFLSYKIKYKEELTIFGQWFYAHLIYNRGNKEKCVMNLFVV